MTRGERIQKLANAIKRYRGRYHPETLKWQAAPQPNLRRNIAQRLRDLGLAVPESLQRIDGFKTIGEFHAWIATV